MTSVGGKRRCRGRAATAAGTKCSRVGAALLLALLVAFISIRGGGVRAKSIESAPVNLASAAEVAKGDAKSSSSRTSSIESSAEQEFEKKLVAVQEDKHLKELLKPLPEAEEEGEEEEAENDTTGARHADCADASCGHLLAAEQAEEAKLSDNARLVALQAWLQERTRRQMAGATRSGLELFERLSLSGGCAASLMNLMSSLGELKAFAFKFIDASAKLPSGLMFGLLSDFGDFDECLAIRSNPSVKPEQEVEEGAYSGKYCLLSLKLNYHVKLAPQNPEGAPDGILPDGLLWDQLMRQYWISNSTKGFQVGVCVPSRCTSDDLEQIFKLMAKEHNFSGEITQCQDSNDLQRQQTPDWLQRLIIKIFACLLCLNLLASLFERYACLMPSKARESLTVQLLACFSIQRNWRLFVDGQHENSSTFEDSTSELSRAVYNENATELTQVTSSLQGISRATTSSSSSSGAESDLEHSENSLNCTPRSGSPTQQLGRPNEPLRVDVDACEQQHDTRDGLSKVNNVDKQETRNASLLGHLAGLKLLVVVWITVGHSFLYPSANNYQYYRAIINMNITRDSVWFAATNFTLGIDTLLYTLGLVFALKLAQAATSERSKSARRTICSLLLRKILRFWPTYLALIGLAIVAPLLGDGPMWPQMVERRLGEACRQNWWANLLMINNFASENQICLPSSWFLSAVMQCLLIGSLVMLALWKWGQRVGVLLIMILISISSSLAFGVAYQRKLRAPAIRMDESFVLEIDDQIYRLYTSTLSNLGPFLVGMLGGLLLNRWQLKQIGTNEKQRQQSPGGQPARELQQRVLAFVCQLNGALAIALIATVVLSSVFHDTYSQLWAAIYWSCHRLGWALVTGYLCHQCATGRWQLARDLLSLACLRPLSKLTFTVYLAYPLFIHLHSGLVRDGLHVSLYNMLNIYTTRLAMTFAIALALHLLVELPLNSMENLLMSRFKSVEKSHQQQQQAADAKLEPLLAVAPAIEIGGAEKGNRI